MYIDEHGRKVFVGQEALDGFCSKISKLMENRKLHYRTTFQNLPISVENRKGSIRRGVDQDGAEWETKHKVPYGYIPGTKGPDGDAVDVFVGSNPDAAYAYVVYINNPRTGDFDEYKVFLGFDSKSAALDCFRQHYDEPEKFFRSVDEIPMWKFKDSVWIKRKTEKRLVASLRESSSSMQRRRRIKKLLKTLTKLFTQDAEESGGKRSRHEPSFTPAGMFASGEEKKPKKKPSDSGEPAGMFATGSVTRESREGAFASLQVPQDYFGQSEEDLFGNKSPYRDSLGTDQAMKKSILGHHQNIMVDPQTREGGPGSGPQKRDDEEKVSDRHKRDAADIMSHHASQIPKKTYIEQAGGKYVGKMENPKGGEIHGFRDPKTGTTLWMKDSDIRSRYDVYDHMTRSRQKNWQKKEAQEHGVSGQKWGIRHARKDAAGQKSKTAMHRDLSNDPKTLNMMGYINKGQAALAHHNAQRQQAKQSGQKVKDPQSSHQDALNHLVSDLGWKAAGLVARTVGLGDIYDHVVSALRSPGGQKMFLHTDKDGRHSLDSERKPGRATRRKESRTFESRMGSFLREAKKKRIYYARSLQRYGKESNDLGLLSEAFPDADIFFPRTKRHAELGMDHFHRQVDKAREVVIRPLRKRRVTAGVFSEAQHALHKGKKVHAIVDGEIREVRRFKLIRGGNPGGEYARVILKKKKKSNS